MLRSSGVICRTSAAACLSGSGAGCALAAPATAAAQPAKTISLIMPAPTLRADASMSRGPRKREGLRFLVPAQTAFQPHGVQHRQGDGKTKAQDPGKIPHDV